jgi:hypothetical protein
MMVRPGRHIRAWRPATTSLEGSLTVALAASHPGARPAGPARISQGRRRIELWPRVHGAGAPRPVFHTMLYGNVTGEPFGWATPEETRLLLSGDPLGPDTCPPAIGGPLHDSYLVPAASDYYFWLAWHQLRGREDEWVSRAEYESEEITFYTGTHRPWWLWSGEVSFPLCVSYSTLREVRQLHRGRVRWIVDSRGFSELSDHGRWTIPPADYVRDVARYDNEIGGLQWAAPQDWMCEDEIIHGGTIGRVRCVGTGLSEAEHQRRTVENFLELTSLWPQHSDRPSPFIPVLQGRSPDAYLRCYQMYLDAGIDIGEDYPLAGVGSVCRLQSTGRIAAVARALGSLGADLHWFGLKLTGLRCPEIPRDISSPYTFGGTQSLDSASWSLDARYGHRLPGCTHVSARTGQPTKCNNCPRYATMWRARVLASLVGAEHSAARWQVQGELFDTAAGPQ